MTSDLDEGRVKEFVNNTLTDYKKSLRVDKYVENFPVKEDQVDAEFKRIGTNAILARRFFMRQTGSTYLASQIIGLGRGIALGEAEYFINRIINAEEIIKNQEKKAGFTLNKLINLAPNLTDTILILHPNLFFKWFRDPTWGITDIREGFKLADMFPCFRYSSKSLKDKIIAIDKLAVSLMYVEFFNEVTESNERLDIKLEIKGSFPVSLFVRSLIKLNIHDGTRIRVIELD